MNTRMIKGTPIRDHMICMIILFNKRKILRVEIDGETQVDMILQTLLDAFKQFKLNYTMNKLIMSFLELMKEPQMDQGIIKDFRGVHMEMKDTLGFSHNNKKKNSFKKPKQGKTKAGKEKSK